MVHRLDGAAGTVHLSRRTALCALHAWKDLPFRPWLPETRAYSALENGPRGVIGLKRKGLHQAGDMLPMVLVGETVGNVSE